MNAERLREHIAELASVPRPAESSRLEECRRYVAGVFEQAGWDVEGDAFEATNDAGQSLRGVNLVATHRRFAVSDKPRLCVGAHLDSLTNSPGADDNASAVAVLLELARALGEQWPAAAVMDLELVAFDLEEWGMLGGARHARRHREQRTDLRGMVSLEMLGYCDHRPQSQQLPRQLVGMYPDTGNFIAVIGNQVSGGLIEAFRDGLRTVEQLPVETLQVPENGNLLQATRLSDHSPFWDEGFAALMLTDTSFMRNPYYHTAEDTIDTLDFEFLQKVGSGCVSAVRGILAEGLPAVPHAAAGGS